MKKLEVFQKLIDSVKANCPGVITEDVQAQFNTEFDDAIASVQNDAYQNGFEKGQQDGFKDGYAQAKRIADENLKSETDKIIAQCDDEAVAKITEILQAIDQQNTEKLQVVYDMVKEYQAELEAMDQDHAQKLNTVQEFYLDKLEQKDQADAVMLEQYAEAVDREHAKKLKTIVQSISKDHAAKLNECVDFIDAKHVKQLKTVLEAVDKKHAKQLELLVESINNDHAKKLNQVVEAIDNDHTKKLQTLTESIDKAHTKKLKTIVESIDRDHTQKLQNVVKHEKNKKIDLLTEHVEKYLNYALEQALPKKQLISEQKYNVAMKTLDKFKDYLNVNGVIQESKEGIFTDYENQINSAKEKNSKLISENAMLQRKLNRKEAQLQKREAQIVLQDKLKDCTPAQAKYLRVRFRNAASPKVIQESIEDARATFKKLQAEKRAKVQADMRAKRTASTQPSSVVLQSKEKEPVKKDVKKQATAKTQKPDSIAEYYANYLKRKN